MFGLKYCKATLQQQFRHAIHTGTESANTKIRVATILSRLPLVTPPESEFNSQYYAHVQATTSYIPIQTDFYFKKGSLALRRYLSKTDPALLTDEERREMEIEETVEKAARNTKTTDIKSLERELYNRLYLIVKNEQGWCLPGGDVAESELLHQVILI